MTMSGKVDKVEKVSSKITIDNALYLRLLKAEVPNVIYRTKSVIDRLKDLIEDVTVVKEQKNGRRRSNTYGFLQQLDFLKQLLNPTSRKEQVFGISCDRNDSICQRLALDIAHKYIESRSCNIKWITLYRGFQVTKYKDCGLIIITNVLVESTEYRLELLRDVLAVNDHVPRIVCTSGGNAYDLFEKIHYPLHGFIHLTGTKNASIQ